MQGIINKLIKERNELDEKIVDLKNIELKPYESAIYKII